MGKAKESKFIKRLRRKIRNEIRRDKKGMTKVKLDAMRALIHVQLKRTAKIQKGLGARVVTSFDENTHPAPIQNSTILRLQRMIYEQIKPETAEQAQLKTDSSHQ